MWWIFARKEWPRGIPKLGTHCNTCKKRPAVYVVWPGPLMCDHWLCRLDRRLRMTYISLRSGCFHKRFKWRPWRWNWSTAWREFRDWPGLDLHERI